MSIYVITIPEVYVSEQMYQISLLTPLFFYFLCQVLDCK